MKYTKTNDDVTKYLRLNGVRTAEDLIDITALLSKNHQQLPDRILIHSEGCTYQKFKDWFQNPQFPTTYAECCEVLGIDATVASYNISKYYDKLNAFYELLICRDAWWKVTNDWKPDWTPGSTPKYSIYYDHGSVIGSMNFTTQRVFSFPSDYTRCKFYETFKDKFEICQELI
ncbi:MAG: hypothetical protein IKU29_04925 [Parabacteroides sp.]|nr:hypothetical protein [Parabacteroides sp.]